MPTRTLNVVLADAPRDVLVALVDFAGAMTLDEIVESVCPPDADRPRDTVAAALRMLLDGGWVRYGTAREADAVGQGVVGSAVYVADTGGVAAVAEARANAFGADGHRIATVRTRTGSVYDIDLDAGQFGKSRRRPHDDPDAVWADTATGLRRDGEILDLTRPFIIPTVGEPMVLWLDVRGDGVHTHRATSPVTSIEGP